MRGSTRCVLASIAAVGLLAGCATYDYGYGYAQPYYGYDYGPYSYDYGPYYYDYGAPAIGFDFSYRHRDRDWRNNQYRRDYGNRHYGAGQHGRYSASRGNDTAHNARAQVAHTGRSGRYARNHVRPAPSRATASANHARVSSSMRAEQQ